MGITPEIFERYRATGLTLEGEAYVNRVRSSPPARRVGGSRFLSVSCRFPSEKMGCTIQAESRTGEYPLVLTLELDDDVIEFYDQPSPVHVARIRGGRRHVSANTPDFLVLRSARVEVIEVKPREAVLKARDKYPEEWAQRNGCWVCLPIAAQFDQMGIRYWVHVGEDIDAVRAANLNLLVAARRLPPLPNEAVLLKALRKILKANAATTVQAVITELALKDASIVLRWIATRTLFAATSEQLLSDVRTTRVFGDEAAMERFVAARRIDASVVQPPATDLHSSPTKTHLMSASKTADSAGEALTDRQLELALARYEAALPALKGERPSTRNERRLITRMEAAISAGQGALWGFVPRHHLQGNRVPRITTAQEALMTAAMRDYFTTAARRSVRWVYASIAWSEVPRVSYKAFLAFTRRFPKHEVAKARSGHRAGLAARPQSHPSVRAMWPTTAWELVHIDHTPIDEKVWGQLGVAQILGRPWLTTMIDGWSHAALAFWLSFAPPSWESLAMLLRDCVRRHHRLPLAWISDQGSEFGGTFWETFSANHACTKFDRAVADARCGSQVERSFHVLHRDLIYQLDGNMQNDQEWRSATSSHKSDATARYLLERIYTEIDRYLLSYYNQKPHGPNTFSPQQRVDQSEADIGVLAKSIEYDVAFRIETAHRPARPAYRVDSRRGIRVGQRTYWHSDLAQPRFNDTRVEVRIEPFDSSLLYAHLDGRWIECIAAKHAELKCMDEFGRWAQSAIDYYGKPFAAAAKRAADERFAANQVKTWASEQEQASVDTETSEYVATRETVELASMAGVGLAVNDAPGPTRAPSPFDQLRVLAVKPLKALTS